jgi:type IV pilus assembly protein PilN
MPNINLLPWREEDKLRRQNEFNMFAGFALLVGILCAIFLSMLLDNELALQSSKNRYLQNETAIINGKIVEIKELRKTKADLKKRMDLIEKLQNARSLSTHLLDSLAKLMSPGVYLESVQRRDNTLWIEGLTESNNHLANMLRNFEHSQWFKDPLIRQIDLQEGSLRKLNKFSLRVDINSTIEERTK